MISAPAIPRDSESNSPVSAANNGTNGEKPGKEPARARHEAHTPEQKSDSQADIAGAREAERRTRESENSGWLVQNVHSLLAITIMLITFSLFVFVIWASMQPGFKDSAAKDIVIYILGALTTVATQVVSYYFGSSSGSADKSRALSTIAKRG